MSFKSPSATQMIGRQSTASRNSRGGQRLPSPNKGAKEARAENLFLHSTSILNLWIAMRRDVFEMILIWD